MIGRQYFCSYPAQSCVYHIKATKPLPSVSIGLEALGRNPQPTLKRLSKNTIQMRGLAEAPHGMLYDSRVALVVPGSKSTTDFATTTGKLSIPASAKVSEFYLLFTGNTDYDETKGNPKDGYTFRGVDPAAGVERDLAAAVKLPLDKLLSGHIKDHSALSNAFKLTVSDPLNSASKPTDELVKGYNLTSGDPYLESLIFDFGRYLLIGSSRENSMPPNLQGVWSNGYGAPWSGDYHVNINLQMNVWGSEATGLGGLLPGLWSHMKETWVPRGSETAKLLYGAEEGWVIHNELNTFGSTGVKGGDTGGSDWHFYHAGNAWMMQHVWDHYDYTRDAKWWREVGYPLLKGVAQFQMHMLVEDKYTKDGSLVVGPCNSPEQQPTTFGCSINQQQIWEVLQNILKGWAASGDTDLAFKKKVETTLSKMDTGVHVGRYGQIQEWKRDMDNPDDQHRHLSHLYGWYPGFAISTGAANKNPAAIEAAVATTLLHRGPGNWKDANAGWAKVWRAACWAHLSPTTSHPSFATPGGATNTTAAEQAYWLLKYALQQNFARNLFSMYGKGSGVFQIDANFGWVGAVLAMLSRDLDQPVEKFAGGREVLLGAAVPESWLPVRVEGLRVRGGGVVDFTVGRGGAVSAVKVIKGGYGSGEVRFVDRKGRVVGRA